MLGWQDEMMTQERNKDLWREAEQERLAHQFLAGRDEPAIWDKVKELFSRFTQTNSATKEKTCATCPSATDMVI